MARARARRKGFFTRWWESQADRHFQIIVYSTIISTAAVVWGFMFLFMLGGATDPTQEEYMVPFSWLSLFLGGIVAFYAVPEFLHYMGHRTVIEDILSLDSRPEVLRRRKEAEDAADLLGRSYQSRLMGLYSEFEIKGGKRYKVPIKNSRDGDANLHSDGSLAGKLSVWWNTSESRLSGWLPGLPALEQQNSNRAVIAFSASALFLLMWNSIFGIATGSSGSRDHTLDVSAYIGGVEDIHQLAPHFDPVSLLLIGFMATVLWSTMPETTQEEEE